MRSIGVVTVGRSDYGIYLPVLRRIERDRDLRLRMIVAGMHLAPEFGLTVSAIEADGFQVADRVEMLLSSDTPEGIAKSMGLGVVGFAQTYARCQPDMLVVLGDRFEMHAAALAALPFKIPIAHIHGGEITQGAIDDALRHSISKLSHLHFTSTDDYARRLRQMGEEPWRIAVAGAPSLDSLHGVSLLGKDEIAKRHGLFIERAPLLVTFHPTTLDFTQVEVQVAALLGALEESGLPIVFTLANADAGGRAINEMIADFALAHKEVKLVENLGTQGYFSMMALAAAMVGNSSSGIIEAASFKLPVVNIGTRQEGRVRGHNVINVGHSKEDIIEGIMAAVDPEFRRGLDDLTNPYYHGNAAEAIVDRLRETKLGESLIVKKFRDAVVTG